MTRAWTAREALAGDRPEQARLFNLCFRKDKQVGTFVWKYDENPDGPSVSRVACDPSGRVVGGYSYMPRRFRRDGRPVVLMQASDAMTEPDWRGQGIFTGLDDLVCEASGRAGVPLAFAYSGRQSLNGFLRNGWRLIGHARLWRRRFRTRRSLLRLGRVGPLAATLAWLNWRYVDTPTGRQECFGLFRGDALAGYLVAEFVDGNAFLVDHLARDEAARSELLAGFTGAARARGMEEASALLFDHHPALPALAVLGWRAPLKRRAFRDIFPFIVRPCREDCPPDDLAMERWHLADGDRDAEHMSP
jgi:hypothetical protein